MKIPQPGSSWLIAAVLSCSSIVSVGQVEDIEPEGEFPPIDLDQAGDPDVALLDEVSLQPQLQDPWNHSLTRLSNQTIPTGLSLLIHGLYAHTTGSEPGSLDVPIHSSIDLAAAQLSGKYLGENWFLQGAFEFNASKLQSLFLQLGGSDQNYLRAGYAPTCEGGIESTLDRSATIALSPYLVSIAPFRGIAPLIEVSVVGNDLGRLRGQLIQDVVSQNPNAPGFHGTTTTQPAFAAEWTATFGRFRPLIQFGSYDQNHSSYKAVGFGWQWHRFKFNYDYVLDARSLYDPASGKEAIDRIARLRMDAIYAWERTSIHLFVIDFGVVQGESDVFGNPPLSGRSITHSDNKRSFGMTQNLRFDPHTDIYVHAARSNAKFLDISTQELNDTDSKFANLLQFGILHYFY